MADEKIAAELTRDEVGELMQRAFSNHQQNATGCYKAREQLVFALISDPEDTEGDHVEIRQMIEQCRRNAESWQKRVEYFADLLGVVVT